MANVISLSRMVDLALGTPEVGAVNFNVLHDLLHILIRKLNVADVTAEVDQTDGDISPDEKLRVDETGSSSKDGDVYLIKSPYYQLQDRLFKVEKLLDGFNSLPNTDQLIEEANQGGDKPTPVNNMWQYMHIQKRVDANENGIEKLAQVTDDILKKIGNLTDANISMESQIGSINMDHIENKLHDRISQLETSTNELQDKIKLLPDPACFEKLGTMERSEEELKNLKHNELDAPTMQEDDDEDEIMPNEGMNPVSNSPVQTPPPPSNELAGISDRINQLFNEQNVLMCRVDCIESQLGNKIESNDLNEAMTALQLPNDLLNQLRHFKEELEKMNNAEAKLDAIDATFAEIARLKEKVGEMEQLQTNSERQLIELKEEMSPGPDLGVIHAKIADLEDQIQQMALMSSIHELEPQTSWSFIAEADDKARDQQPSPTQQPKTPESSSLSRKDSAFTQDEAQSILSRHNGVSDEEFRRQVDKLNERQQKIESTLAKEIEEQKHMHTKFKSFGTETNRQMSNLRHKSEDIERELQEIVDRLKVAVNETKKSGVQLSKTDDDALDKAQEAVKNLQNEIEKLNKITVELFDENKNRRNDIQNIYRKTSDLQQSKVDGEYVQKELKPKADQMQLDGKVNRNMFDSTVNDINVMILDILEKLNGSDGWKEAFEVLKTDVDGKFDRLELKPLKDWLENRLKDLSNKIKLQSTMIRGADDAAGLRKQLHRFNCISCDKRVEVLTGQQIEAIPSQSGLPAKRSTRPYTTFELDTIRQQGRIMVNRNTEHFERAVREREEARKKQRAYYVHFLKYPYGNTVTRNCQHDLSVTEEITDVYAQDRPCGGVHTLTYPNRRVTRIQGISEEVVMPISRSDVVVSSRNELDIKGLDGHIYKGQIEAVVPQQGRNTPTKVTQSPRPPRATSARHSSRKGSRPQSSNATRPLSATAKPAPEPIKGN